MISSMYPQIFDGLGREHQARITDSKSRSVELVVLGQNLAASKFESLLPIVLAPAMGKHDKIDYVYAMYMFA